MHYPTHKIVHTTAFVTPVVEHWLDKKPKLNWSIMRDQSDDQSPHELSVIMLQNILNHVSK